VRIRYRDVVMKSLDEKDFANKRPTKEGIVLKLDLSTLLDRVSHSIPN
jgi:hypothetical protein